MTNEYIERKKRNEFRAERKKSLNNILSRVRIWCGLMWQKTKNHKKPNDESELKKKHAKRVFHTRIFISGLFCCQLFENFKLFLSFWPYIIDWTLNLGSKFAYDNELISDYGIGRWSTDWRNIISNNRHFRNFISHHHFALQSLSVEVEQKIQDRRNTIKRLPFSFVPLPLYWRLLANCLRSVFFLSNIAN